MGLSPVGGGAIDLRVRPPTGGFLSQRLYRSIPNAAAVLRRRGYDLPESVETRSLQAFEAELDRAGIAIAAATARIDNEPVGGIPNVAVAEIVTANPDRFIGIGCVRISPDEAAADVDECVGYGFVGITVEPGLNEPPMHADDAALYPVYEAIEAAKLPAFIAGGDANPDISYASPVALDHVARDFPGLVVVAAHGGWPWVTEMLGVAWRRSNLWVLPDLYWAGMPGQADYTIAANGYLRDRMLFGTSYPAVNIEQYVARLLESGLTEQSWVAISQENPRRLLGWES